MSSNPPITSFLGPDGGDDGGRIVASGTPEEVARTEGSFTGEYLRRYL